MAGPNTRRYRKFQIDLNNIWLDYHKRMKKAEAEFKKSSHDMRWEIYEAEKSLADSEVHKKVNEVTSNYLKSFFV